MNREAYVHCEALVRSADKERFLASLFAPPELRPHLFALYAFNIEIARVREVVHEPLAGEIRLRWWIGALSGEGRGEVLAHPVAAALLDSLERRQVSAQPLLELIEARQFDLSTEPMATTADFQSYMRRTCSGLIATAANLLGADAEATVQLAEPAGLAYALAMLLNALAPHAARRQLYLPLELLQRYGVLAEDIFARRTSAALRMALAELRTQARAHYTAFVAGAGKLPQAAVPAFLPVTLVPQLLTRMERHDPLTPIEVPQLRRQLALLRAAWFGFRAG